MAKNVVTGRLSASAGNNERIERCCQFCGRQLVGRRAKRYCNKGCAANSRRTGEKEVAEWLAGNVAGHTGISCKVKPWVRQWVLRRANNACEQCGWNECHPHDGRVLLEIDHIDGDATNT